MGFSQHWILRGVLAIVRHPRRTLLLAAIVLIAAVGISMSRLTISSDQNKLFSAKVSFFHNYLEFAKRFPENEAVYIVIEPRDPADRPPVAQWAAAADAVADRLSGLQDFVMSAEAKVPLEQLGRQSVLFEDPKKLPQVFEQTKQLAQLAALWGQNLPGTPIGRFLLAARLSASDQSAGFVAALADSLARSVRDPSVPLQPGQGVLDMHLLDAADPLQLGYSYVADESDPRKETDPANARHRILVRVYPRQKHDSLTSVTRTVDTIRDNAVDAARAFPQFKIGVTGRPALEADEMRVTDQDSRRAEIWALIGVFIGLVVLLRSIWLALAAELALGVAIGWTFGWTTISVGQLNLLSLVFLIALIGIGMDYLVQILMRYRMEARRYPGSSAVWVRVFKHVGPPINTACLGAAGAFGVAVFTEFQGAAELGIVAGGGLILCLIAGYTVLPALLTLFPPPLQSIEAADRYKARPPTGGARRLALAGLWIGALAILSPNIARTSFNPGLIDLQVQNLESVKLIRTLQTWMAVVTSQDLGELAKVREKVAGLATVAATDSILNTQDNAQWLRQHEAELPAIAWAPPNPVTAADLPGLAESAKALAAAFEPPGNAAKQRAARSMRDLAAALDSAATAPIPAPAQSAARLSTWQEVFENELRDMLDAFHPQPLKLGALPASLRGHYVSADGYYALYITPKKDLWERPNLIEFESQVEEAVATIPAAPPVTGIASNVLHTTRSIHRAFYQSTAYALALIFFLVLLDFKSIGPTLAAISVLALGLPMLVAIMGVIGVDWNFANFFGLPILIGAGHEYGVFMVHRYLEARRYPRRVWKRWDVSDRALLLCAYITCTSFGFFWLLARHQGLKSLGLVMALGTACIYFATIMVLRPILRWKLDRAARENVGAS